MAAAPGSERTSGNQLSARDQPKTRSACAFQQVTHPVESIDTTASRAASSTERDHCSLSISRWRNATCAVTSRSMMMKPVICPASSRSGCASTSLT